MPTTEELNAYYNSGSYWGHGSDKTQFDIPVFHHQAKARLEFINQVFDLSKERRVLDIGAGFGVFESSFKRFYPFAHSYHAVELDERAQKSLKGFGVQTAPDIKNFEGEKFDLIILSHLLEHLNEPIAYLKNLKKYCHAQTRLFIELPNEDQGFKVILEPHVLFFSPKTLTKLVQKAGFEVELIDTCGTLRSVEKVREKKMHFKSKIKNLIPFKTVLKKIKNALKGKKQAPDPFSVPDLFDCTTYGGDRRWIRCLLKVKADV